MNDIQIIKQNPKQVLDGLKLGECRDNNVKVLLYIY